MLRLGYQGVAAMEPAEDRPEDVVQVGAGTAVNQFAAMEPAEDRPEDLALVIYPLAVNLLPQWSRPRIGRRTEDTRIQGCESILAAMEPAEDRPEDVDNVRNAGQ